MNSSKAQDLIAVFEAIETVKQAVERFEAGEINVFDALQLIRDAAILSRAA